MPEDTGESAVETTAVPESVPQAPSSGTGWLVLAALAMPAIAGTVILFNRAPSHTVYLMYGTMVLTALCLALDSWFRPVTHPGRLDKNPLVVFLAVAGIWLIGYPAAFFSRQMGNRSQLGWISIAVAVFFVACGYGPTLLGSQASLTCDHPQVQSSVSDLVRQQPFAWGIQRFQSFGEIGRDPSKGSRMGWCEAVTREGNMEIFFTVEADPHKWFAQRVRLLGIGPPPCGNPVVLRAARQILKEFPETSGLKSLTEVKELSQDPANKVRLGRGIAVTPQGRVPVRIKVIANPDEPYGHLVMVRPEVLPPCNSPAVRETVATLLREIMPAEQNPTIEKIDELNGASPGEHRLGECVFRADGEVQRLRFLVEWATPLALEHTVRPLVLPD